MRMSRSPQNGGFHRCTGGGPLPLASFALLKSPSSAPACLSSGRLSFAIVDPTLAASRCARPKPPAKAANTEKIAGFCLKSENEQRESGLLSRWHDYCLRIDYDKPGRHRPK